MSSQRFPLSNPFRTASSNETTSDAGTTTNTGSTGNTGTNANTATASNTGTTSGTGTTTNANSTSDAGTDSHTSTSTNVARTSETGIAIDQAAFQQLIAGSVSAGNGKVELLDETGDAIKSITISSSRNYIVSKYNWTGIIRLGKLIALQCDAIDYQIPGQLAGRTSDDEVLLPDELIIWLIHLQYKSAQSLGKDVQSYVDGLPGGGTLREVFDFPDGMISFMDQTSLTQANPISLSLDIFDQENIKSTPEAVYDQVREIVRQRNGLFSDSEDVTNVVGFRTWKDSNFANSKGDRIRINDHFMVLYRSAGKKHVFMTMGSTDPGEQDEDGHLHSDQTMTLTPGWHQAYQAAGRTGNVLRRQNEDGTITFKTDTGMNFHKANSIHRLRAYNRTSMMKSSSKAQVHTNVLGSQTERDLYYYIAKLQRTLIGFGKKWENLTVEQQNEVDALISPLSETLENYTFYQGYVKSGAVDAEDYLAMVEGWIQESDWSYDPDYGNVTQAFSDGCQVFENTREYARFMWAWQQFSFAENASQDSRQERWYYNLIDAATLTHNS